MDSPEHANRVLYYNPALPHAIFGRLSDRSSAANPSPGEPQTALMPPLGMQARPLASDPIVEPVPPPFRGRRVAGGADSRGSGHCFRYEAGHRFRTDPATPSCARGWRAARSLSGRRPPARRWTGSDARRESVDASSKGDSVPQARMWPPPIGRSSDH